MLGIPYRYLTDDVPGVGGRIKDQLEDFVVEEVPLYVPVGEGEHVYFLIEKSDLSTYEAIEQLSKAFRRPTVDFGYAGLKDRKGVTRQYISLSGIQCDEALEFGNSQCRVLSAERHRNKLRVGHLRGNRFSIKVRGVEPAADRIGAILDKIAELGLPNYYGPQRFGVRGESQWIGRALVLERDREVVERILGHPSTFENNPDVVRARYRFAQHQWREARAYFPPTYREERRLLDTLLRRGEKWRAVSRKLKLNSVRLYVSAFQSYLFNRVLEDRLIKEGSLVTMTIGDVAYLHRNGAVFAVDDEEGIAQRCQEFDISPSGPVYGKSMLWPSSQVGQSERLVLEEAGVDPERFEPLHARCGLSGGRRPLRVRAEDLKWTLDGDSLDLQFFLPKGSYATTLIREITKNEEVPPALCGGLPT